MPTIDPKDPFVQEVFRFLDVVRESGSINMMGAGSVLTEMYGFDKTTARAFLSAWMENFGKDSDV